MTSHVRRALLLLLAAGCGDGATPETTTSAAPATSAEAPVPSASGPSSASALRAPPAMAMRASFERETVFFPVGRSIIACTRGCVAGTDSAKTAETFVVDRNGSKQVPLNPEGAWRSLFGPNVFNRADRIDFYGEYPGGKLYAGLWHPDDRGGYGGVTDLVYGPNNGWERTSVRPALTGCPIDEWYSPARDTRGCSETRRKLLPKLAAAPFKVERFVDMPGGAGFIPLPDGFARTSDFVRKPAPWKRWPHDFVPLADGSILAADNNAAYRIRPDDSVELVETRDGETVRKLDGIDSARIHIVNDEPWIAFKQGDKAWLAMIATEGNKAFQSKPVARAKRPPHEIPLPTRLSDTCTTPFAILASNTDPNWVFGATMQSFMKDKSLASEATFMSIVRDGANDFGVQLRNRAALDKVIAIAGEQRQKPELACLDALAKIPDLTNPPAGVEIYFVNYNAQQQLAP